LDCKGPLLIADGRYSQDKIKETFTTAEWEKKKGWYPDKFFINKIEETEMIQRVRATKSPPLPNWGFYVPGTSMRGPFRAQAERIIRSLTIRQESPGTACDPFEQEKDNPGKPLLGCSARWETRKKSLGTNPYKEACPACKLFGFAGLAGRIAFTDADITGNFRSVYRDMIGIDRFTGGVAGGANMRFHAIEGATFTTTVTVINFELWQLGLLAYVFQDFKEELVPIGFGKTKGFGKVEGKIEKITLRYLKNKTPKNCLAHLGSLLEDEQERQYYGIEDSSTPPFSLPEPRENALSLYRDLVLSGGAIDAFWASAAQAFNAYIDSKNRETTGLEPTAEGEP
jgi:CRISPR-associated RAMP protein (TIGR02581 family)